MCLSAPSLPPTPATPARDETASLAQETRKKALSAQGVRSNIFTTALGDSGFSTNVKGATLLGQSTGA